VIIILRTMYLDRLHTYLGRYVRSIEGPAEDGTRRDMGPRIARLTPPFGGGGTGSLIPGNRVLIWGAPGDFYGQSDWNSWNESLLAALRNPL
jgi:hypothetical protein